MPRIKSAKRYKIWGSRGFCCKFEDGCKAVNKVVAIFGGVDRQAPRVEVEINSVKRK